MLAWKRLFTIGKHVALVCATLLLLVMSVSSGRPPEIGSRLTVQMLRQVIGFQSQHLRRPANAQTKTSRFERSGKGSDDSSSTTDASATVATLHAWRQPCREPNCRLIAPYTQADVVPLRVLNDVDVARARAPPFVGATDC